MPSLAANGDSAMRLVPTEFGISTDEASQTDRSDELRSLWHKLDARGDVDAAVFHTDITAIDHDHYGWLAVVQNRTTFHPYRVWCDFARLLAGQPELPRHRSGLRVLLDDPERAAHERVDPAEVRVGARA